MAQPLFEVLSGPIDGVNPFFTTSTSFKPGSPVVWVNGQAQVQSDAFSWSEWGPRILRMSVPPKQGDSLQVFYITLA